MGDIEIKNNLTVTRGEGEGIMEGRVFKNNKIYCSTLPLGFVHVSFIVVPENPFPNYPVPTPLWLLLDCC